MVKFTERPTVGAMKYARERCQICTPVCQAGLDLNGAAAGLAEASRLLSASIYSRDPMELVEFYLALVKAAKARTEAALQEYRDHLGKHTKFSAVPWLAAES